MGERRGAYRILVGKPDGKRPLGRLGRNGRAIIKWIFKIWIGVDWIDLAWHGGGGASGRVL